MPSASRAIEHPQSIVSLPHPVDNVKGQTRAAVVWSGCCNRRKRAEAVVAVDGEGVNIYNIQSPRLVTSYAVSPQTYFTSAPFSIYLKRQNGGAACRYTYISFLDSSRGGNPQVLAFVEAVQKRGSGSPRKFQLELPGANPIFSINVAPVRERVSSDQESHQVIVISGDGFVRSLTENLSSVNWEANLQTLASSYDRSFPGVGLEVSFAELVDAQTAAKGLLRNREDVLAALDSTNSAGAISLASVRLLVIITSSSNQIQEQKGAYSVHILALPSRAPDQISSLFPSLRYLLRQDLPQEPEATESKQLCLDFAIHLSSGHVYQLLSNAIVTYDLTSILPRIASKLEIVEQSFNSFVRISQSLILTSSCTSSTLYDVKYKSIQGLVTLNTTEDRIAGRKRKRSGPVGSDPALQYVAKFPNLGIALALCRHELISQNISIFTSTSKRSRHTKEGRSLLIDSIGKGLKSEIETFPQVSSILVAPLEAMVSALDPGWEKKWRAIEKKLNKYASQNDVRNFERIFAGVVGMGFETANPARPGGDSSQGQNEMTNGDPNEQELHEPDHLVDAEGNIEEPLPEWDLSNQKRPQELSPDHRQKAVYAIKKIFSWCSTASSESTKAEIVAAVKINFYAPNVLKWLIRSGYLTAELLKTSLCSSSVTRCSLERLNSKDIVNACVNFDPSLRLLYVLLLDHPFLECPQIVQSIKVLIQSLDNHACMGGDADDVVLLKKSPMDGLATEGELAMTEQDWVASGIQAASNDLDLALTTLEDGLSIRSLSLRMAFSRLHAFPAPRLTQALREQLTNHEIIFLVQLLRIELAEGGWTSRYIDAGPRGANSDHTDWGDPSDRGLLIISNLLGSALDAIGAGGWLAASATEPADESDEMLLSLRAEISAALEGIHEASFMKGVLNDFLRYANAMARQKPFKEPGGGDGGHGRNKPITVQREDDPVKRALPLGFKVEESVGAMKISSGGELRRKSAREIGNEISRRVGRYTLERIVV